MKLKRIGVLFLTVWISGLSILGCGNSNSTKTTSQETVENQPIPEDFKQEDNPLLATGKSNTSTRTTEVTPYIYEQELNVIDDKYRNYYEIFVASFYDSDCDGMGDLKGIIEKLDYLNDGDPNTDTDLGINGIWLMPIMPSPTYHKYDVTNYYDIDSAYGSMEDFQLLLEECHKRDIHVLIDLVMNHTSSKHPWFLQACEYLEQLGEEEEPDLSECPYVEYYHFTKSEAAPTASHYRIGNSKWYYEGMFWSEMPDLNLYSEGVRHEFEEIAAFYLDMGVDGFRLDAVKEFVSGSISSNVEILSWFTGYVHEYKKEAYLVAEVWENFETIAQYYAGGIDSAFNFSCSQNSGMLIKAAKDNFTLKTFGERMVSMPEALALNNANAIDAPFLSNHDTGRVCNALVHNEEQMKMAAGLLLTMNGSPFIYYGEEIGMSSKGDKDENKRIPFVWSLEDLTGMTKPPADADSDIAFHFEALDQQMEDPLSLYHYYKRGLRLRNENPEIARGEVKIVDLGLDEQALAITKTFEGSKIGILYNNHNETLEISLSESELSGMEIRGYLTVDGTAVTKSEDLITLPKKSIAILK